MTVLILSLSVPVVTKSSQLTGDLSSLYPDILSYVLSFAILGTFWIRHHIVFHYVTRVDRVLLWLNIIFLMTIGFIPFSTALLGRYPLFQIPIIIYGSNLIATSILSQSLLLYISRRKLISTDLVDEKYLSKINTRLTLGPAMYVLAIVFSFVDPEISIAIYVIVLGFVIYVTTFGYRPPSKVQSSDKK